MKTPKKKALIIGNTSKFHFGSYLNCKNLTKLIKKKYTLIGFLGDSNFKFNSYEVFKSKIKNDTNLLKKLDRSDVVFFNGEGFIEPNSPYGKALFYLARFVRRHWPNKKLFIINFTCFDQNYDDWSLFDKILPRDYGTYRILKKIHNSVGLGFDCCINEKINIKKGNRKKNEKILVLRGRKQISIKQINEIKKAFRGHEVCPISAFWEFKNINAEKIRSKDSFYRLLSRAFLVVSSSFHGIIFSALFGIPFIPIRTVPIKKNESIAADMLGKYYKKRNLSQWLRFYADLKNYNGVRQRLKDSIPSFRKRTLAYIKNS